MSGGILVFDESTSEQPSVVEAEGQQEFLLFDLANGILVFDESTSEHPSVVEAEGEQEFLLFDPTNVGGEQVASSPQDFLLVDQPPVIQPVLDTGETEFAVITTGGPQGAPGTPGATGPTGRPGYDGAGAYFEVFGFATPATLWTIVHNRNSYAVNVETVDTNGDPLEGDVRFVDLNTIEVEWYYPTAGEARLFR